MAQSDFPPTPPSRRDRMTAIWEGPFVMGLLVTLLGVLALGAVAWTSLVSVLFYGVLLGAAGVLEIVQGVRARDTGPSLLFVLSGILSLLVGGFVLTQPDAGLVALSLMIAAYFLASGFFRGITAVSDRHPGWGWDLAYGAVSVALGALLFLRLPTASFWVLGLIVGVEILIRGLSLMAGALAVRGLLRDERAG
ncbi:HdeD family acid-resistance protein [Archangium primigenium]|uniref:HdeD family acid-resistance protein n=1 Tax=[Archangium] primigenium TaxID=2792470 RepID=UPI001EF87A1E|nr:DUF308 domain-containing protein [Archangium primigenium]